MKDPKLIINFNLTDSELAEKVNMAVDKYIDDVCKTKINDILDEYLESYINGRINYIFDQYNDVSKSEKERRVRYRVRARISERVEKTIDNDIINSVMETVAEKMSDTFEKVLYEKLKINSDVESSEMIRRADSPYSPLIKQPKDN